MTLFNRLYTVKGSQVLCFLFNPHISVLQISRSESVDSREFIYLTSARVWFDISQFQAEFNRFVLSFFSWFGCLTKVEEPRLPYNLLIAGGRIVGCILFPRVLALWGACGVIVIVVGIVHGDTSSNPGRKSLHFT